MESNPVIRTCLISRWVVDKSFLYSRKGLAYALPHRLVPLGTSAFYNASDLPMDCETVSDVPTQCPLSGTSTSPVVFTAHRLNGNGC